jgi:hypothetical protein
VQDCKRIGKCSVPCLGLRTEQSSRKRTDFTSCSLLFALSILDNSPERELINVLKDQIRRSEEAKLFLTNPEEIYTLPGLAVVGSSNFTAEGLTRTKELNVVLTSREEVLYLNRWFDDLWEEALEFLEDLLKVIDFSGLLPESPYLHIGTLIDPQVLFKQIIF